ncbi:MAG: hypothetical protein JOZ41_06050 [Chloroflexi bacterium]|nr:hypothetical protein [Chloroflexota bacterium]
MNKYIAALALVGALAVPVSAQAQTGRPPDWHHCKPGYTKDGWKCRHIPPDGQSFAISAPGTSTPLEGVGTAATAGHEVTLTRIAPIFSRPKGDWIRLQSNGSFPPLHARQATIYQYIPKTGKLVRLTVITRPGMFVIVPNKKR